MTSAADITKGLLERNGDSGSNQFFRPVPRHAKPEAISISRKALSEEITVADDPASSLAQANYSQVLETDKAGNFHTAHRISATFKNTDAVFDFFDRLNAAGLDGQILFDNNRVTFLTSSTSSGATTSLQRFVHALNTFTPLNDPNFANAKQDTSITATSAV